MSEDPYFRIPYTLTNGVVDDVRDAICQSMQEQVDNDPRLTIDFDARCDYAARVSGDIDYHKLAEAAVTAAYKSLGACLSSIKPESRF